MRKYVARAPIPASSSAISTAAARSRSTSWRRKTSPSRGRSNKHVISRLDLHLQQLRRRVCAPYGLLVRVRDRDDVAAAVAVPPDRTDRLPELEVRLRLHDAFGGEDRLECSD